MNDESAPKLSVLGVMGTALRVFWADFAPIVLSGFSLVTLPAVAVRLGLLGADSDLARGAAVSTLLGVLGMLFVCVVTHGVLSGLVGAPLGPRAFWRFGLRAARPGLVVSLVLGAGLVAVLIVLLFIGAGPLGQWLGAGVVAGALWLGAALLPAVPAAIVERLGALDALRRAAELTRGHRGRLLGLLATAGLALVPAVIVVQVVVYGPGASRTHADAVLAAMTLGSPGFWIQRLFELLVFGLAATLPAVVYAELARRAQDQRE